MESVVKHVPNTYYLELRQDYIALCQSFTYRKEKSRSSPHCKALILSIMEKWTNEKIGKKKDLHVYMTHPQWVEEMYGLFARNVIIDSLDELIYEELIARESYKSARGGRNQYKYKLNYELLNKRLNPTLKNQSCEEEQDGKINDQGVKFNVATVNNQSCSSSPTLNIQPFIKSVTNNQSIESQKESAPARIAQLTSQEKQTYNNYCLCFKKDMPNTPLPNVTEKFVKDIVTLASFITAQEEMQSLFDYAKARIYGNNPRVYPANLLNWRDAWKQEQTPLPWSQSNGSQPEASEEIEIPVVECPVVVPSHKPNRFIRSAMKECFKSLNKGKEDEECLELVQHMYDASGIDDMYTFRSLVGLATQTTEIYAYDRSEEDKLEYFCKALAKALKPQYERIAK